MADRYAGFTAEAEIVREELAKQCIDEVGLEMVEEIKVTSDENDSWHNQSNKINKSENGSANFDDEFQKMPGQH